MERGFSVFILLLAASFFIISLELPFQTRSGLPGSGFYPTIISGILMVFSIYYVGKMYFLRGSKVKHPTEKVESNKAVIRQAAFVLILIVSAALIKFTGLLLSIGIFVFSVMFFVQRMTWKRTLTFTLIFVIVVFLVFEIGFGFRLPRGIFGI